MAAEPQTLPEGRYGRSADERADRKLKIVGGVLLAVLLGFVGWAGVHYITKSDISAELVRRKTMSDDTVQVVLEIRKSKDSVGVCTLRSLGEDGSEVARKDVTLDRRESHFTELVTLRTTARAFATELEGCRDAPSGH
ncbi:hypothetical protein BLA24_26410 [Streptomyces cinnamoneus]|uniref:Uncharacterized protein n=1 Tax=Streptomyces cinnamoneus TaxID=53446 RepID=A0A2G1XED6_STRCJ|nr:DUF4307 domain-containing protein [Streptomyces cinnamoneus]PHQ49561.1 hypothetical protein BLA24_26410 [Streptomyces cinnamoneus]PPT14719.1 DUF4307 domain-containing protein [Streptomyces cinnamoneus]